MKFFDDGSRPPEHFLPFKAFGRNVAELPDIVAMAGVYHLSSIVYRNVFRESPPACLADEFSCEVTINMVYSVFGKFYCFDEYMSAYRVHTGGSFSVKSQMAIWRFHLTGYRRFALYLGPKYWLIFANSVRGFTRYVLNAPEKTREVESLTLGDRYTFLSHFIVAGAFSLLGRSGRRVAYREMAARLTGGVRHT